MQHIRPENFIIIDIETAPTHPRYEALEDEWKLLWDEKVSRSLPEQTTPSEFYEMRAGVMAEFSKIVCISIGYFNKELNLCMRVKSFYGTDEQNILQDFIATMQKIEAHNRDWCFAGHNIKEFDIPFICRRLLINRMRLPAFLDFQNMKPWETNLVDTFQYWRFGDYKHYTSLKLLAATMGIPSPKDDIDGSMVAGLYWCEDEAQQKINLDRIARYCEKDVITTGNIILRFKNIPTIHPDDVEIIK